MRRAVVAVVLVVSLAVGGCGDDDTGATDGAVEPTEQPTAVPTESPTEEPTSGPTATPEPECDLTDVYSVADDALAAARLAPGGDWTTEVTANPFAERTNAGPAFAARLALDCSVTASQAAGDGQRLLLAAWTGQRIAFVIQATDPPTEPYVTEAVVTILTEDPTGEWLNDDLTWWAATLEDGESIVIGHNDYNLGATAKAWQMAIPAPEDAEPTLDAERHAIEVLQASGARNVSIAQPAEIGSEEGYVQFVSATGQISVVDVAPAGWFDPLEPRYNHGDTTIVDVGGVQVRVTEPSDEDIYAIAGELGWGCGDYVWILEPPFNGTTDELLASVTALLAVDAC
ncbi:MAG: PT domain-containing protein [Acidimicrobiales bacterium]|nr:PT domain-containing protein [Acidimicrobiales bacterium]